MQEHYQRIINTFNRAADTFDAPALSFWHRYGQRTVDRLQLQTGDRILDVCCGTGASALVAAHQVGPTGSVLGVDLADALLDLGRAKAQKQGLINIEFQMGDFEKLGLPDASFDAIVSVFGIFFVPDMEQGIQELWRMVRPGGQLAITSWGKSVFEPAGQMFWEVLTAERPDLVKTEAPWDRIVEPEALRTLLEAGGATQVDVISETDFQPLHTPEDWWTMLLGGGVRGLIEQLEPAVRERIRSANLEQLRNQNITQLEVEVLYAIARK
ncbi:MAG: class I SAM-dependent methyltransferase [Spirulina sp. SIO3F2]|nr:class I SAM-dependent methyltransferase [Spirulina sp. SIO3F2]